MMLVLPDKLLLEAIVIGNADVGASGSDSDDEKSIQVLSISSSRRSPTMCLKLNLVNLVRLGGGA